MQSADPDICMIKDIPGYKVILKVVLKSQIQRLVEQLADHTGEESVILTASVSDGSLSHLGSESGKVFLEDHDEIKSQFLGFCVKRHHRQNEIEKEKQQQTLTDPSGSVPSPRPRISPNGVSVAQSQFSPQSQSLHGVHPVSLTQASPHRNSRGGVPNVRHKPYPNAGAHRTKEYTELSETDPSKVIKIESFDVDMDEGETGNVTSKKKRSFKTSNNKGMSSLPSHTAIPSFESTQLSALEDSGSESSSSAIVNKPEVKYSDTVPPEGLSLDSEFSNLTGIPAEMPKMDTAEPRTSDSGDETNATEIDPSVNIKVEAVTDSELEITSVGPCQTAQEDDSQWISTVQTRMGYGPSTSGSQHDMADQSRQRYKMDESLDFLGIEESIHVGHSCTCGYYTRDRSNYNRHVKKCRWHLTSSGPSTSTQAKQFAGSSVSSDPGTSTSWKQLASSRVSSDPGTRASGKLSASPSVSSDPSKRASAKQATGPSTSGGSCTSKQMRLSASQCTRQKFMCQSCGKSYLTKYGLTLHFKAKHEESFKHQCSVCNKKFNQTIPFRYHCSRHLNVPLYKCPHCRTTLTSHGSLKRHLNTCSKGTETFQKFKCDICNASFPHKYTLLYHQQGKHQPPRYKCHGCFKLFAWRSSLKVHMKHCKCRPTEDNTTEK